MAVLHLLHDIRLSLLVLLKLAHLHVFSVTLFAPCFVINTCFWLQTFFEVHVAILTRVYD